MRSDGRTVSRSVGHKNWPVNRGIFTVNQVPIVRDSVVISNELKLGVASGFPLTDKKDCSKVFLISLLEKS